MRRRVVWMLRRRVTSLVRHPGREAEIYLIGTSHVSKKSCREVEEVIEKVRPSQVMIELCPKRFHSGMNAQRLPPSFEALLKSMGLNRIGLEGLAQAAGLQQGEEMKIAAKAAKKQKAELILGDVGIEETLTDLRSAIKPQDIGRLLFAGQNLIDPRAIEVGQAVFSAARGAQSAQRAAERISDILMTKDNFKILAASFEALLPEVYDIMVHRRDEYMAQVLLDIVEDKAKGRPVVCVVGYAHCAGVERRFFRLASQGKGAPLLDSASYTLIP